MKAVRQRRMPNHQKDFVYERELKLLVGRDLVQLFGKQMKEQGTKPESQGKRLKFEKFKKRIQKRRAERAEERRARQNFNS